MVETLDKLWKKGTDFLGSKYSILCGAMSWISEHNLVTAISQAGGFGIIACGSMSADLLKKEILLTKQLIGDKAFGVNIIIMHPDIYDLLDVCIEQEVSHVILAGGIPMKEMISYIKKKGIKAISFAPVLSIAKRLIRNGIDALIIEGMEAGGHIGPISTSVLAQEILPYMQDTVPIFVAGGIGHGSAIVNYLQMGASGCQMGTIFACAYESIAHPNFKKALIQANSRDTVVSVQLSENFPVIPVRVIKNEAAQQFASFQQNVIEEFNNNHLAKEEAQLKIEHYWAGSLRKAVIDGDVTHGSLMAGQSVGMVINQSKVQEIMQRLIEQANVKFNI